MASSARGTLVETWLVPVCPRCVGGDETPVVENEGKISSMRQMVSAAGLNATGLRFVVAGAHSPHGPHSSIIFILSRF